MHKSKAPILQMDQVITAPIDVFSSMSGIGRTKITEMVRNGDIAAIKLGKRTLIVIESYRQFLKAECQPPQKRRARGADSFFDGASRD